MKLLVVTVLCAVGLFFSLSAAVGIVRMPDIYTRLQCSSKSITMGALPLLLGLAVAKGPITAYGGRALLVGLLIMLLGSATAHALARAAYKVDVPMWPGAVTDEPREERPR
ncbi:MAG TPA: monovalent cation/H(+) antiporter subunit G [Jatrophihabitans sp.]|nr:monovalent cation/H(+) antiporter subunit G [Jatrophihabitans sp.]